MTEKKSKPAPFKVGDIVYFTAYLKKYPGAFYMCKGRIERCPEPGVRKYWKTKVLAISDRPVGGKPVAEQASLLGMILSKKTKELTKELTPFLKPSNWITKDL